MHLVVIGTGDKRKIRIGFVAKFPIKKGDELFYDYGICDAETPWTVSDAKRMVVKNNQLPTRGILHDEQQPSTTSGIVQSHTSSVTHNNIIINYMFVYYYN